MCRYFLNTKDQGLVLRPDKEKGLDCFVDDDWAGSWGHISSNDPLSSHSRTGYYITYAGCPLMWKYVIQPLISLSTTEAKYITLFGSSRSYRYYTPTEIIWATRISYS